MKLVNQEARLSFSGVTQGERWLVPVDILMSPWPSAAVMEYSLENNRVCLYATVSC